MAQKEINVNIKLQSKTDVQKQLDNIIKSLNNNNSIKLNVDLKDIKKDFVSFQSMLNDISKNIQNVFKQNNFNGTANGIKNATKSAAQLVNVIGKSLNIGDGTKAFSELQKRANEIRKTVDSMAKINFNTTKNGNIKDATISYTNNMGKAVTETMKWKQVLDTTSGVVKRVFTTTNVKVSENIQSINNLSQKINSLKQNLGNKLNILSSNNLIDNNVISSLQNRLNSLNTKTPKSEIESLKLAINNLSSSESSIVRIQNKITQMETNLSNLKKVYANTFSNSNNTSSIQTYEKELNNLKNILNNLKSGQSINKNSISGSLNQATNASRNLSNSLKQNNTLLNQGNINAKSLGNSLKQGLLNAGLYMTTYQAVRKIIDLFKDASNYLQEVDKYKTNIQMITNSNANQVENMINSYKNLTEELHATNTEMLSGIEEYSRAGYSEEMTRGMLANSVRGSKLANQSVEETSNQLIAIRNAYDMTTEQVEEVTDALATMDATASTTFSEIAKAMQNTSYSAQMMGTDFKDLISYITVASEATRKEPSEIGNSLKSIYSRYANIKLGNLDDEGKSINDTEKALSRIGIKIRDTKDQFRDFDDVLKEFMQKVKEGSISQIDMLAGVQALGGTRQKETLLAIINNMDRLNELQQAINESSGSTKKKFNEMYSKSDEAKINDLKRALQDFYSNILDNDTLKNGIDLLTKFINTFGDLPTIVTITTAAIVLFKKKAISGMLLNLNNFITSTVSLISKQGLLTTSINGTKSAFMNFNLVLSSNPLGVLAVAMIGLTTIFSTLKSKIKETEEEVSNFNNEYIETLSNNETQKPKQAQELFNNYKQLSNELKTLKSGTDEYKSKEEELKSIQEQLIEIYPEINNLLNDNKNTKKKSIEKTQELINKENELQRIKAKEVLEKNDIDSYSDFEKLIKEYKAYSDEVEKLTELSDKGKKTATINTANSGKSKVDIDTRLTSSSEYVQKLQEQIEAIGGAYIALEKEGTIYEGIADKTRNTLNRLGISFDNTTNSTINYTDEIENAGNETEETKNKLEDLIDTFSNANDTIGLIQDTLKEYNENGVLSGETISKILSSGDNQLIAWLGQSNNFQERGNELLSQYINLRQEAYENTIKQANEEINAAQEVTNENANAYNVDTNNKIKSEEAKQKATNQSSENQKKATVNVTNKNASVIKTDTENLMNALNSKLSMTESFINGSGHAYAQLADKQGQLYKDDYDNYEQMTEKKWELMKDYLAKDYKNQYEQYVLAQKIKDPNWQPGYNTGADIQAEWTPIYNDLNKSNNLNIAPITYDPIKIGDVKNDSSSSSSKNDYSVDNLEDLYDRYLKINTAINILTGNLDILKEKQDNLVGSKYLKSLQEEINYYKDEQALIKQKIAEESKERWDLRVKLDSAGFKFDDNDINSQILNYESQLKALTNAANAMADGDEKSAEAKKKAQERVKDLNEAIKDYNTLIGQTIPATQKEWESLNNSIKSVYETMSNLVADGESKMYDIYKYYADKRTNEIEEQENLVNSLYSKETEQEDLASKQSELAKIKEQMNLYELDNSTNGQAKLKELQEQYDELLKEMNTTIKDNQYEGVKQKMEDEKQAIEDSLKPENINKLINDGLVNGFIKIGNQTIQLNDAINDMTSNTTIGFQNMIKEANEYNNALKNAQATLKDIGISSINSNLGYDTSAMTKATTNNNYTNTYNINVEASGLDEQTVSKMILDEIKEYDKTWK